MKSELSAIYEQKYFKLTVQNLRKLSLCEAWSIFKNIVKILYQIL